MLENNEDFWEAIKDVLSNRVIGIDNLFAARLVIVIIDKSIPCPLYQYMW